MKEKYISFEDYTKRKEHLNRLRKKGFKLVYSKSRFKVVCGVVCLSVAIFPNGLGLIFYPLGFMLLGIGINDLRVMKDNLRFKLWLRFSPKGSLKTEIKRGCKEWNI